MIYVFLANGFEEMEAIAPIDLLRRAEKTVITVGVGGGMINGAHGITVQTDITDDDVILSEQLEMIVLPGGMPGTLNLEKNECVQQAMAYCAQNDKYIAAICAAPTIPGRKGLLKGKNVVCYPGYEDILEGANVESGKVAVDGNIVTGRSAGVAREFGLKLVELLCGRERAKKLEASLYCDD